MSEFWFLVSEFSLTSEFLFLVSELDLMSEFWFLVSQFSLMSEFLLLLSEFGLMSEFINSAMQQQMELLVNCSSCLASCSADCYFGIDFQGEHSEHELEIDFYLNL